MHRLEPRLSIESALAAKEIDITRTPSKSYEVNGASATVHAVDSSESLDHLETRYGTTHLLLLWKFELLSMVVSVGALLSIVAVLFAFDGKPMTRWKAIAQPNTVVSALSTLAKSSMLMVVGQALGQLKWQHFESRPRRLIDFEIFDSASRGPWGALELLCRIRWRALAGSTGAIVTVLAVAIDPFAQQVIQFNTRLVTAHNETSAISAARSYDMNSRWESIAGAEFRESYNKVRDTSIIGAVYQGIFGPHNSIPFDCPSGDCKWDPYESIGICNTCVDVTPATNATRICEEGGHASWESGNPLMTRTCHYETPLGYRVDGQAANWKFMTDYEQHHTLWNSTTYWQGWPRSAGEPRPDEGIAIIAGLKFVEYDDTALNRPEVWLESAHECTISWCALNYDGTQSTNGHLQDKSRSTPLVVLDKLCPSNDDSEQVSSQDLMPFSSTGDAVTSFLIPAYKPDDLPEFDCASAKNGSVLERFWNDPKAFWVNAQDKQNIIDALGAMFTTTFESISRPGDDPARAIFRAESFPDMMDHVASSMTNSIRTGPNGTEVYGTVEVSEQHIQVHWPWMILPAALVVLSVIFMIVTMVLASRRFAGWKSSALPSFYHGFAARDVPEPYRGDIKDMQLSAREVYARLGTDEEGRARLMRTDG